MMNMIADGVLLDDLCINRRYQSSVQMLPCSLVDWSTLPKCDVIMMATSAASWECKFDQQWTLGTDLEK